MKEPLVSIIVPVYNVEEYLERCLCSIVNQTYRNIEIIVINDGSTDNSSNIINNFKESDSRFIVINKENGGQASARNIGIKQSNGEFLLMVDSDDYIASNTIECCVDEAINSGSDLLIFDFYYLSSNGHKQYIKTGIRLDDADTGPCNKFYHHSLWIDYKFPEGYWYEDLGIVPAVISKAEKIQKIDKAFYYYDKSRSTSQTNQVNVERYYDVIPMLQNVYKEVLNKGKLNEKQNEIEHLFIAQLLYITVLLRLPNIENSTMKRNFVDVINKEVKNYVPNWYISDFMNGNSFTNSYKKVIIKCYLNKNFLLGDLLWKFPKKIKTLVKGF